MDECAPGGYATPAGYETAAVRMDECAPGGYPAPAGYERPPSGWTSERPAETPRTRNPQRNTPSEHTGEQEPSGPGRRTPNAAHQASTPVNRSQGAQDTVRTTQHNTPSEHTGEQEPSGPGHRTGNTAYQASTPVKMRQGPRTPHTQHKTPSGHAGEQEPSGPGHRTRNTKHRAGTPVKGCQGAQDTVHATQHTERANRWTGAKGPRTPYTQHNTPSGHTGEKEPSGTGHGTHDTTH